MAMEENQSPETGTAPAQLNGAMRYVARQPILCLNGRIHGYELLFRNGTGSFFTGDGDQATRTMLDNSVIFGLDKLTAGMPAFINCTAESLTEQLVDVLPPSMTVLEILETLDPTPELLAACHKLKSAGFRLALDDFVYAPKFEPLMDLVDYIKVDFIKSGPEERNDLVWRVNGRAIAMVAEKVESQQEFQLACDEGFTLFQGYYFCRPILLQNRKIPANQIFHIQMLQLLHDIPINIPKLSALIKRDPSMTYRLLRLVNSPVCAMRQEVRSIQAALLAVGDTVFRRIATLAIAAEFNAGNAQEVLRMAFVRGRFCELSASLCNLDGTEQYLLGLLSLLPAMLRVSMEDLTPQLPLRDKICEALLGTPSKERCLLQWLEYHERGDWNKCDAIAKAYSLEKTALIEGYKDAVVWAEEALLAASE